MINKTTAQLIEAAERNLDGAQYPFNGHPRIWNVNFLIATIYALIAIARGLEDLRKEIRNK